MIERLTVLLVEDEDPLRSLYERAFDPKRFNVVTAIDGEAALEYFGAKHPDIIFTDTNNPCMEADEFLKRIIDDGYHGIPTVVMSGIPDQPAFRHAVQYAGQLLSPAQRNDLQGKLNGMPVEKYLAVAKPVSNRILGEKANMLASVYDSTA